MAKQTVIEEVGQVLCKVIVVAVVGLMAVMTFAGTEFTITKKKNSLISDVSELGDNAFSIVRTIKGIGK